MTLDTIAGSLLRIRADGKTRRIARALEPPHHRSRKSEQGMSHALFDHRVNSTRGQLLTGS
jgi:hypothetical protein